jgi:hypothetical protein
MTNYKRYLNREAYVVFSLLAACWLLAANLMAMPAHRDMDGSKAFLAGAASVNITPYLGGGIVGGWKSPPADHVHDDLHARCLVLDDGNTRLAFIIADNIGLKWEVVSKARQLIEEKTGLSGKHVLIASTHTHSSLNASVTGEYGELIIRRLADLVQIAINNLEPARIGWGAGSVPQHVFVRRWRLKPGITVPDPFGEQDLVLMNPGHNNPILLEPAGIPDPEVSFLSVQSAGGRPIALMANYSLHYVGGVVKGHISADYFGVFADRIQELLGADRQVPPFVAMMSNGTSGDVNNIDYSNPRESRAPYEKMRLVAEDVAREVFRAENSIRYYDWVPLQAAQSELTLQVRKPDQEMIERANRVLSRPDTVTPGHRHEVTYARRILDLQEWPDSLDVVLQAFCIGDLGITTFPFETFAETGLELKASSPVRSSFSISLANGSYGYLPTPAQHELGGYETWMGTSRVELNASVKISARLLELLSGLAATGNMVQK